MNKKRKVPKAATIQKYKPARISNHKQPGSEFMEMAKLDIEEFESNSDEAFLVRAEMEKKLRSL